jgi:hypothetical protein
MISAMVAVGYAVYVHGPEGGTDIGMFVRNVVDGFNGAAPKTCTKTAGTAELKIAPPIS